MNYRRIWEQVQSWAEKLNDSYQPVEEKPLLKIAELAVFLPALGLFYLWSYFNKYGIHYYLYFDLKDAVAVLYEKLMPIIYICVLLSLLITILIPGIIKRSKVQDAEGENKKGFSVFGVLFTVAISLIGFYVLLEVYEFTVWAILIFLVSAALSSYLYLFVHRNVGSGVAIVLAFIFALNIADKDAKNNMKVKPKFEIVLKNHSDIPILTEGDKSKYLIYKTSNFYFIKDDSAKVISAYSTATGEKTSFKVK